MGRRDVGTCTGLRVGSLWDTKYCTFALLLTHLANFQTVPRNRGCTNRGAQKRSAGKCTTFSRRIETFNSSLANNQVWQIQNAPNSSYRRLKFSFYFECFRKLTTAQKMTHEVTLGAENDTCRAQKTTLGAENDTSAQKMTPNEEITFMRRK